MTDKQTQTNTGALWGGRFASGPSPELQALSRSTHFDWRLVPYDLAGSRAHARALHRAGLLDEATHAELQRGLDALGERYAAGELHPRAVLELADDVPGAVTPRQRVHAASRLVREDLWSGGTARLQRYLEDLAESALSAHDLAALVMLTFHRGLHADTLRSPLVEQPQSWLAPLRSTVGWQELAAERPRPVVTPRPEASTAAPYVVLLPGTYGRFEGPVVRAMEAAGCTVDLLDLAEDNASPAIALAAIKYADLSSGLQKDYVFDPERMTQTTGDTGPYLQYAHARCCQILRRAEAEQLPIGPITDLAEPAEQQLALLLSRFGEVVHEVADALTPHKLCTYLYEVAGAYSTFYEQCPVLKSEGQVQASRLGLCALTQQVLAKGLDLLGIQAPDRM